MESDRETDWDSGERLALEGELTAAGCDYGSGAGEFRESLKRCFLDGQFSESLRSVDIPQVRSARPAGLRLLRTLLTAAAAVILAVFLFQEDDQDQWGLRLIEGDGMVALLAPGDSLELVSLAEVMASSSGLLGAGAIDVRSSRFELTLPGELVVELTPGTVFDGSRLQLQDDGRRHIRVDKGEVLVRKSKNSASRPFLIKTLDAEVEVLGTTLGVLCGDTYTCVCVMEGEVDVQPNGGELSAAVEGQSLVVMRAGAGAVSRMDFPPSLCSSSVPEDHSNHHVCTLVAFGQRVEL